MNSVRFKTLNAGRKDSAIQECLVEFENAADAHLSQHLTGIELVDRQIMVLLESTSPDNSPSPPISGASGSLAPSPTAIVDDRKVYVGNLHPALGENELRKFFIACGHIFSINISKHDPPFDTIQYAFLDFTSHSGARLAMEMNGRQILGRPMHICAAVTEEGSKINQSKQNLSNAAAPLTPVPIALLQVPPSESATTPTITSANASRPSSSASYERRKRSRSPRRRYSRSRSRDRGRDERDQRSSYHRSRYHREDTGSSYRASSDEHREYRRHRSRSPASSRRETGDNSAPARPAAASISDYMRKYV